MHRRLRSIHLSMALFSMPFLLIYAIGAVGFAHREWLPRSERPTEETRKQASGITDARILARQWRGELESVENSPGVLKFRIRTTLGRSFDVTYSIATGDTMVKTSANSFLKTLAFIHASHGIWAFTAALVSLALLTLGSTGLYLWFSNHSSRWIGVVALLVGATTALGLILSMRSG
jgi:hypothetical protein